VEPEAASMILDLQPKGRVIDRLRAAVPGSWRRDRDTRDWIHESGRSVYACAAMAPRYDGDDDSFITQYRWHDTGERAL
jgi:hypothetical protein